MYPVNRTYNPLISQAPRQHSMPLTPSTMSSQATVSNTPTPVTIQTTQDTTQDTTQNITQDIPQDPINTDLTLTDTMTSPISLSSSPVDPF